MKKNFLHNPGALMVAIAGSSLLPSCSAPPAQTTTINIQAPEATETKKDSEIADARTADDSGVDKPTVTIEAKDVEPSDRDVEDPVPAKKSASKPAPSNGDKSDLMDFYDRLPSKHFTAFGGVNRRSLLKRKGAIVDYQHNFIEIPGSADERDGDLRALQITLFPNGKEPWCAVSRIVWPQGQTLGALNFYYGYSDDFDQHPRTVAAGFFPYKLKRTSNGSYESAWLPQRGLDIRINSAQDSEFNGPIFRYNRKFGVGESAFKRIG